MRVIIVGGGIAGLTLANSLQHAGIDYVLLEGRSIIDPQVGASIGILANGARILDQLDCYDGIRERTYPIARGFSQHADGSLLGEVMETPRLLANRCGYSISFLDRQDVLRVLADHVSDQSKILLNKRVSRIESGSESATVHCTDGTSYEGDLVIGADGVNSAVRKEMWRLADEAGEGQQFAEDKKALFAEYKCYFGISNAIDGLENGTNVITYDNDRSYLGVTSKDGRHYWFAFAKMDRRYESHEIPKFSEAEKEKFMEEYADLPVWGKNRRLRDLDAAKVSGTLTALEEAKYDHWSYGRIACIGDAIHKMTPNLGAGGNSAIESAGVLTNLLHRFNTQSGDGPVSLSAARQLLGEYQEMRMQRINKVMEMANDLTRLHAVKSNKEYFISHYVLPNSGDFMAEIYADYMIGSPLLDFLPPPQRSLTATMPFNQEHGWGKEESRAKRALYALPLLLVSVASYLYTSRTHSDTFATASLGGVVDVCSMYGVWLIESTRRNNRLTFAQIPLVFALASRSFGMGIVAPIYYFLHYTLTPLEKFKATDHRLTSLAYTNTVLPLILSLALLPNLLATQSGTQDAHNLWIRLASLSPLSIAAAQWALATFVLPNTISVDSRENPRRDVPAIRFTVAVFGIMSAAVHLSSYMGASTLQSGGVWYDDSAFASAAGLLWLLYSYADLIRDGMMDYTILQAVGMMVVSSACVGPAATFAAGWLVREEALLNRRHKDAVVPGWYEKKQSQLQSAKAKVAAGASKLTSNGSMEKGHSVASGCRTQ